MTVKRCIQVLVFALAALAANAALEPISPVGDEIVPLLPDVQKKVLAMPTLSERIAFFAGNKGDSQIQSGTPYRTSRPLVFRFRDAGNPQGPSWNGPWKVFIGKKPDLSDARVFPVWQDPDPGPNDGDAFDPGAVHEYRLKVKNANLEIGTTYYWKISCRRRCSLSCYPSHGCERSKKYDESPVSSFRTEDIAPRWIGLEGRDIFNIRDLGGRAGLGGRRVRQGMVFRGCTLNDDSWTGDIPGKNRMTPDDIAYMAGILGIRTDLDLRTEGETGGMTVSPLGKGVRYVHHPSLSYKWVFGEAPGSFGEGDGRKGLAENFRLFCDPSNYPVYFHCSGGADRTGTLAWVLNAVLGVSRHETETDWEITFYPDMPDSRPDDWRGQRHFDDGFGKYGDADTSWNERIILFLKECGITDAEIEAFRSIMLEGYVPTTGGTRSAADATPAQPALAFSCQFTDHAVLQRGLPVAISGRGAPGARVEVSIGDVSAFGVIGSNGLWRVELPPMEASKTPRRLVATSCGESVALDDILVGEVWFASGQSNMEMPLWHPSRKRFRDKLGGLMLQSSSNDCIRLAMTYPERGVSGTPRHDYPIQWTRPSPEWLKENLFSALAWYFARELQSTLDVPVGIMGAWWGGTAIAPWVPDSGWESVKDDPFVSTNILQCIAARPPDAPGAQKRRWPGYPGDIFNEMVAPFAPYTMRGMIWYQGESNIDENFSGAVAYSTQMRALFDGWRREFGCPSMKLLFVELAQFSYPWIEVGSVNDDRLACLCDEQQRFAREEPDAHLACISDVGDVNDIHPARKMEVALRLAALAYRHAYGMPVAADPPRAVAARLVAPGEVEITLENVDGLYRWMPEVSLWTKRQKESSAIRFVGADGTVVDCESEIKDGKIIAKSIDMPSPAFVTHIRRNTDESNIYNSSTLPLGTFKLEVK